MDETQSNSQLLQLHHAVSQLPAGQVKQMSECLDEHQSYRLRGNTKLDSVIENINYLLDEKKFTEAVILLDVFLTQCPVDFLEDKGSLICSKLLKLFQRNLDQNALPKAFEVFGKMVEKSAHAPTLAKTLTSNILSKFCECLNSTPLNARKSALATVEICIKLYPGTCGQSYKNIERFLFQSIDSIVEPVVYASGSCLLQFQTVRKPGGQANVNQKDAWKTYQTQLIGSIVELMDELFSDVTVYHEQIAVSDRLNLVPIDLSDDPLMRVLQISTRLTNLCTYTKAALMRPYGAAKQVDIHSLLSLVQRGLAVNYAVLEKNLTTDNIAIKAVISEIHSKLVDIVICLIHILKTNLLPFTVSILRMCENSLKWSIYGKTDGGTKPFRQIRQKLYSLLITWCKTMKSGSMIELISDSLIENILNDTTPYKSEVNLSFTNGGGRKMSKKERKANFKKQAAMSNLGQTHGKGYNPEAVDSMSNETGNQVLCCTALACLEAVLNSSTPFLKPILIKLIQEEFTSLAFENSLSIELPKLYNNAECRRALLNVVRALIVNSHHLCPPPLSFGTKIFTLASTKDSSDLVRQDCNEHLTILERIIHPAKGDIYFPAEVTEMVDALRANMTSMKTVHVKQTEIKITESEVDLTETDIETKTTEKANKETLQENSDESSDNDSETNEKLLHKGPFLVNGKVHKLTVEEIESTTIIDIDGEEEITSKYSIQFVESDSNHAASDDDDDDKDIDNDDDDVEITSVTYNNSKDSDDIDEEEKEAKSDDEDCVLVDENNIGAPPTKEVNDSPTKDKNTRKRTISHKDKAGPSKIPVKVTRREEIINLDEDKIVDEMFADFIA